MRQSTHDTSEDSLIQALFGAEYVVIAAIMLIAAAFVLMAFLS